MDIEAVLTFAEHLLTRVDRMWIKASLDQRQRLQRVLWPDGLQVLENRLVRTSQVSCFRYLGWLGGGKADGIPNGIRTRVAALKEA